MAEPNFTNYRTNQPAELTAENLDRRDAEKIYFEQVRPRLIASERQNSGNASGEEDWDKIVPEKRFPFSVSYDIDYRR